MLNRGLIVPHKEATLSEEHNSLPSPLPNPSPRASPLARPSPSSPPLQATSPLSYSQDSLKNCRPSSPVPAPFPPSFPSSPPNPISSQAAEK